MLLYSTQCPHTFYVLYCEEFLCFRCVWPHLLEVYRNSDGSFTFHWISWLCLHYIITPIALLHIQVWMKMADSTLLCFIILQQTISAVKSDLDLDLTFWCSWWVNGWQFSVIFDRSHDQQRWPHQLIQGRLVPPIPLSHVACYQQYSHQTNHQTSLQRWPPCIHRDSVNICEGFPGTLPLQWQSDLDRWPWGWSSVYQVFRLTAPQSQIRQLLLLILAAAVAVCSCSIHS